MPKISVVVPVYNNEAYLDECITSICAQTCTDLEIILVDDGSTDRSGTICNDHAARDARIRVIHKPNGGVSSARNAALNLAAGEYLMFVDSDDMIRPNMAETLLALAEKYDAEAACCGVLTESFYEEASVPVFADFACSGREALVHALSTVKTTVFVCDKLFLRSAVKDVLFSVGVSHGEDAHYIMDVFPRLKRVAITAQPLYYYRTNPDSAMNGAFRDSALGLIDVYIEREAEFRRDFPEVMESLYYQIDSAYFFVLNKLIECGYPRSDERLHGAERHLRRHTMRILKCPYHRRNRKIAALILKILGGGAYYRINSRYIKRMIARRTS